MEVIEKGLENSNIASCDYCGSVIRYWDNEVEAENLDYDYIDIHYVKNFIRCPVCHNKIRLEIK